MGNRKISELDQILNLDEQAEFPLSQDNGGTPTTFKAKLTQIATKIAEAITFSNLITNNKHIIGAINEAAQSGGGTTDYGDLENKPQINSIELSGNKSLDDLGIQPSEISKSASGSVATFSDGGDNIPVKAFECDIVAQQASGTPTPTSPLSITGFSQADIPVCGINLWNEQWELGSINASGDTPSTSNIRTVGYIKVKPNTTYYIKCPYMIYIWQYDISKTVIGSTVTGKTNATFTTGATTEYIRFRTDSSYGTTYNNDISINYPSSDIQYHAYKGNAYLVEFGQTIYGGRLIYANSQWTIEATHEILTLDGTEIISLTGIGTARRFRFNNTFTYNAMSLSSHFIEGDSNSNPWGYYRFASGYLLLNDNDEQMADVTALQTWLADQYDGGTPVQFIGELATPVIIPITSSTRVKTISGANNIFSNTGDVELEYFTENADSLAELIKEEIDGERQEHNVVKSYTAKLTSSQYGWFTFVDENGNDLLVTNGVPLYASAIADSKYYSGLFVQQPSGKIYFKVVDANNSSASSFAPIGTSLSNITFNLSYLKF